jgi:hypothetical protein
MNNLFKFSDCVTGSNYFMAVLKLNQDAVHFAARQNSALLPLAVRQSGFPKPDVVKHRVIISLERKDFLL